MTDLAFLDMIVRNNKAADLSRSKRSMWTPEEDLFVRRNLGWMTDQEMGEYLGRSAVAVHLRWDRDLHLPGPSKAPDVYTALHAARILGLDGHQIAAWVDWGLIPGRTMAGGRKIRLIDRQAFRRWVLNPMHWMYFDPKAVRDPELKHMLQLRAKRWGDEWWSTREAADYHGITTEDLKRYITRGELPSFHLPVSLGGRNPDRKWSYHFVRKSDVLALQIYTLQNMRPHWTPAADAWILKAVKLGLTHAQIGRTMKCGGESLDQRGNPQNKKIAYRYSQLKQLQAQKKTARRRAK
jgi:hypothetical protein